MKKISARIVAVVIAAALILALAGCDNSAKGPASVAEPGKLPANENRGQNPRFRL